MSGGGAGNGSLVTLAVLLTRLLLLADVSLGFGLIRGGFELRWELERSTLFLLLDMTDERLSGGGGLFVAL